MEASQYDNVAGGYVLMRKMRSGMSTRTLYWQSPSVLRVGLAWLLLLPTVGSFL
jgi:hypothetical protein